MKTIICGPPHSGKSVLIANLVRFMPSDSYLRINANGDGEGSWSNNSDQEEIARVRTKSANTAEKFAIWTENIKKAFQDIVIIDIGGKLQEDKASLFEVADSFVVLSSNPDMIAPWKDFGESHGCRCLATIESDLDGGHDEIVCREKYYLHARLSGLERGKFLFDSVVIKGLADLIVSTSGYRRSFFLDFSKVGESIGSSLEWTTSEGVRVNHSHFSPEHGPLVFEYLNALRLKDHRYKIFGLKANWVAAVAANVLCRENQVSFFDDRSGEFKAVGVLPKAPISSLSSEWKLEEGDNYVLLRQNMMGSVHESNFEHLSIPTIDEKKPLFLLGRFPMWVIASIFISYSNDTKFLFQPGNHYICVESGNSMELGMIKDL
ncbi:MAG: ATP-binding protein [Bacteroidales bacterium]|nr:ATP-binding protein [Bacteroidales bacterium]